MKTLMLTLSFTLLCIVPASVSAESIPDAILRVTVQQKNEDGSLNRAFHVLELTCLKDSEAFCSLLTITLNQCFQVGDKKVFVPKPEYSATWFGNLKIRHEGNSLIVQETGTILGDDYVSTFRFDYEPKKDGAPVDHLNGFSGGYVKNSRILGKVIISEYVPLRSPAQAVKFDCDVLLPGLIGLNPLEKDQGGE